MLSPWGCSASHLQASHVEAVVKEPAERRGSTLDSKYFRPIAL